MISNVELIDSIYESMNEQLGVNLYLASSAMAEAENLEFIEADNFNEVAGLVIQLNANPSEDKSSNPTLIREKSRDRYKEERKVILRYVLSILNYEIADKRDEAREKAKELVLTSVQTFNNEFLSVVTLLLLFDGESKYRFMCKNLADFIAIILHNEEKEGLPSGN